MLGKDLNEGRKMGCEYMLFIAAVWWIISRKM